MLQTLYAVSEQDILQKFSKIYDLKDLKKKEKKNLVAFLKVKLFVENLREGKKTEIKKQNKRAHNLEILK